MRIYSRCKSVISLDGRTRDRVLMGFRFEAHEGNLPCQMSQNLVPIRHLASTCERSCKTVQSKFISCKAKSSTTISAASYLQSE